MTVEMIETWINDRWPLLLPRHRHDRPEWPYWEAARLASMYHELQGGFRPIPGVAHYIDSNGDVVGVEREVVYDIGSEEGDFPALWSSWGCDVVLFEPNERVWPNIKAIWEANELRPPLECWVGFAGPHSTGELPIGVKPWPPAAYGEVIGDHGFLNLCERPDVPVISIDDMVRYTGKPPTAITIDVEGAEFAVLQGARRALEVHKPKVWVSVHREFARDMYDRKNVLLDIKSLMTECGYPDGEHLATDHESHWVWLP